MKTKEFIFINTSNFKVRNVKAVSKKRALKINSQAHGNYEYISHKAYRELLELRK